MLIAQFNYFIWPFIVVCILNMLLMLNIWKRSRKMSHCTVFNQNFKLKEENLVSSPLGTSKDIDDEQQRMSMLSKQRTISIERFPSIIIEENENLQQNDNYENNSSQKITHRKLTNMYLKRISISFFVLKYFF